MEKPLKKLEKVVIIYQKGNKIKDIIRIALIELLITIMLFAFLFITIFFIRIFKNYLSNFVIIESIAITLIVLCMAIVFILFSILSNSIMYAIITACFYIHKEQKQEKVKELEYSNSTKKKSLVTKVLMILILITLATGGSFITYEEISKLDAGSFFSEKFKGEKIPLLEDVLKFAKSNNIKLNIELKPIGKEVDFEKQVVELIKKYNFEDDCVVTSLVYKVLENTKNVDSNIKTLYVMTIAIGDITDLKYADRFSVEASNVNDEILSKVHNEGKKLFVWTVNTEESINDMISFEVDNIITDNCSLCKELIDKSKNLNLIEEVLKAIIK